MQIYSFIFKWLQNTILIIKNIWSWTSISWIYFMYHVAHLWWLWFRLHKGEKLFWEYLFLPGNDHF